MIRSLTLKEYDKKITRYVSDVALKVKICWIYFIINQFPKGLSVYDEVETIGFQKK